MRIILTSSASKRAEEEEIVEVLRGGGMIVYPTDTCYGIGVDVTNEEAVEKLWGFKGERGVKPVLVAVSGQEMAEKYADLSDLGKKIVQKYWPGAVSVVAMSRNLVVKKAQGETNTLGLRMPNNTLMLEVIEKLGKPISSTSANISGGKNPYSLAQFMAETPEDRVAMVDLFIDAGVLPERLPSTIVDTTREQLRVLRQGEVRVEI